VKVEQKAAAPIPPSLFIARRQLSELQPDLRTTGVRVDVERDFVELELLRALEIVKVVVGEGPMELILDVVFPL
jgi:hypothetical protein